MHIGIISIINRSSRNVCFFKEFRLNSRILWSYVFQWSNQKKKKKTLSNFPNCKHFFLTINEIVYWIFFAIRILYLCIIEKSWKKKKSCNRSSSLRRVISASKIFEDFSQISASMANVEHEYISIGNNVQFAIRIENCGTLARHLHVCNLFAS